jgi:hypothetical protein
LDPKVDEKRGGVVEKAEARVTVSAEEEGVPVDEADERRCPAKEDAGVW